jgi:hypothetical protein
METGKRQWRFCWGWRGMKSQVQVSSMFYLISICEGSGLTCSMKHSLLSEPVLWTRIRRIRMFLGLLDPDLLVRGTDTSIIK